MWLRIETMLCCIPLWTSAAVSENGLVATYEGRIHPNNPDIIMP